MIASGAARVGWLLCLAGAALGGLGLLAWTTGVPFLTSLVPDQPRMMPNTAFALLLLGIAGALRREEGGARAAGTVSAVAALVTLALALSTLAEYVMSLELPRLDRFLLQLLYGGPLEGLYPGRPSPPTAFAVALLSVALLMFDLRRGARARPSDWLALCALFTAFVALVGFAYGAGPLYRLSHAAITGVSMPTAVGLLLISAGLLLERPGYGVMRVVTSSGPGGTLLRRLAIPALLAPALLGPMVTRFLLAVGVQDYPVIVATVSIALTAVTLILLTATAMPLNRAHDVLEASRARIRELLEQAPDGIFIADREGRHTDVNAAGCNMLGFSREEIVGMTVADLIVPEDVARLESHKQKLLEGATVVSEWRLRRKDGSYLSVEVSARILADGRWQGFVRDISERKRAQEQLRQSQERIELALRGADLAAWDWNVRTGEVVFNSRWAEMRGFRPDEIAPHVDSWTSGVHPEDWPGVQKALNEHFEGRAGEYEAEHRVRTKSGEWLWILDRGKVFTRDEQGRPLRMVGTELDISRRKHLEDELRLSLAQSSGILAISADAIVSIDENQRITMFNHGAGEIFGYSHAQAIGAPLEMLIPERFRPMHRDYVARFASGAQVARRMGERGGQIFALRRNGEEFPADAAISRLNVDGTTVLTVALRDITEQKRREREEHFLGEVAAVLAATLDYEETLRSVARVAVRELAELCLVETAEEGRHLPRLEVAHRDPNKAQLADALRRRPRDLAHTSLGLRVLETREPVLLEEITPDYLDSVAIDDDQRRALHDLAPGSLLGVPLLAHGRLLGSMVLIRTTASRRFSMTDLPLAQEVARRASWATENARLYRAAVHATEARDELLGIVAHDLRNPLGTILMHTTILRRTAGRPQWPAAIEGIERSANRMARLIEDLLDLTRIEAGQLSIEQARVPVAALISDCVEAQKVLVSAASLTLRMDVEHKVPDIWADRDRLLQVFENLIGNAIKFTDPGGLITVGAAQSGEAVRIWVANSGTAIPAEHLPHLFDRFWQARKTGRRGAGLGLPIVKGIVEAHGGRVWAESATGRGNKFTFTVPLAQNTQTAPLRAGPHS